MQTIFRRAVPADAPAIADLLVRAWQIAYRGILPDTLLDARDANAGAQRIRSGIETRPEFRYCVLEADGNITGVSVVRPSEDDDLAGTPEIQAFYIHPAYQRLGLGRTMMEHTLADIRAAGDAGVSLWVLRDNRGARAFYEAMGFAHDGLEKRVPALENAPVVRYQTVF